MCVTLAAQVKDVFLRVLSNCNRIHDAILPCYIIGHHIIYVMYCVYCLQFIICPFNMKRRCPNQPKLLIKSSLNVVEAVEDAANVRFPSFQLALVDASVVTSHFQGADCFCIQTNPLWRCSSHSSLRPSRPPLIPGFFPPLLHFTSLIHNLPFQLLALIGGAANTLNSVNSTCRRLN